MKALFKMMAFLLPLLVFSQDTLKVSTEAKEVATEVFKNKKSIDSLKNLKEKEVLKQLKLISLIKSKIEKLKTEKKLAIGKDYAIVNILDTLRGIKIDNEAIYWEEIPRKWTGRMFSSSDTKIRIFRYENSKKIYLN